MMSRDNDVSAVLQQYIAETGVRSVQKVEQDFVEVAQQVPAEAVTHGLAEAIYSEHTPPFDQIVVESFERSDSQQRAGVLRHLLDGAGPAAMQPLVDKGLLPGQPEMLADPGVVQRLSAEVIQQIAQEAVQQNPDVIHTMTCMYATDPALGRTLGGFALSVALGKIAEMR